MTYIKINSEAEWLAVREQNIGGSDIAALFNKWKLPDGTVAVLHAYEDVPEGAVTMGSCSPYTTAYRLYLEKAGELMPEGWNPSERMQAGTYLEPAIAKWAESKWDWKLRKVHRYHLHDTVPGWGASVDFEVHGPGMEPGEIKNVDWLIAKDKWVIEGDEVIGAPLHIQLQLQHYLGARKSERGHIVACVGGNDLTRGTFEAHQPTQDRIAEAVTAFWDGVAARKAPVETADYDTVSDLFSLGRKDYAPVPLEGDAEAAVLARRYMRIKDHAKFTEGILDNLKARIALKLGEAPKATGDGFRVSWPVIERAEKEIPARVQPAKTYRGGLTVTAVTPKK